MRVASDGELRCLVIVTKLTQFYPQIVAIIQGMKLFGGQKTVFSFPAKDIQCFLIFLCYRVWCTAARNGLHWCAARSNELCKHKCAQEAMQCQEQISDALVRTLFIAQMHLHSAQHQSKLHKCIFCTFCKYNNAWKEALHRAFKHNMALLNTANTATIQPLPICHSNLSHAWHTVGTALQAYTRFWRHTVKFVVILKPSRRSKERKNISNI